MTLAVRDLAAGERDAADISDDAPATRRCTSRHLDLADRASVAAFVAGWEGPLHVLVNNAGVMAAPETRTPEGWELQFADQPPRPLRARAGPARRARRGRRRACRLRLLHRRTCARRVVFDDIHFERRDYEPVARLRPVEDGQRAVRGRGDPALGRRRHHRQRADARAASDQPAALRSTRTTEAERTAAGGHEDAGAGRGDVGPAGHVTAARGHRRPVLRGLQRGSHRPGRLRGANGVRDYAIDPHAARRLWEESLAMLEAPVAASV